MVSINSSSTLALRNLQSVSQSLAVSQNRVATGLKVASAKDAPAVWQAATAIRSDIKTFEGISQGLTKVKAAADVAAAGVDAISTALTDMKAKLNAYKSETKAELKTVIFTDIQAIQKQLLTAIATAEIDGANWLDGSLTANVNYVASLDASGNTVSETFTLTDLKTKLNATAIDGSTIATFITTFAVGDLSTDAKIDSVLADVTTYTNDANLYSAQIGGLSARLETQEKMLKTLSDIKQSALGTLVDADIEAESAKIAALQVKQQLGYQMLAITNASAQNVLALFR